MGERRAYVCGHKDHEKDKYPERVFLLAGEPEPPKCSVHNRPMIKQPNVPYIPSKGKRS